MSDLKPIFTEEKQKEIIAKALGKIPTGDLIGLNNVVEAMNDAFIAGYESAKSAWIEIKSEDDLPYEFVENVLFIFNKNIYHGYFDKELNMFLSTEYGGLYEDYLNVSEYMIIKPPEVK